MKKSVKVVGITLLSLFIVVIIAVAFLLIKNHIDSKKPMIEDTYYKNFQSKAILEKNMPDWEVTKYRKLS